MLISHDAMPVRFSVTLPDQINKDLQEWADKEGRPKANLTAFLIESAVRARFPDRYPDAQSKSDRDN
ncbi:MAG: hypothetical protein AAGG53_00480 [Cyanobacteria bacterium P01_H01_bin.152]